MAALRARPVYRDAGVAVVAVESVRVTTRLTPRSGYLAGALTPLALVVRDGRGVTALDMEARQMDFGALCRRVADLEALVGSPGDG